MSTLSTTVRRGLVVTAAAMAAGPVVGGVACAATAPTTSTPLDAAPISTSVADATGLAAAPLPVTRSALPMAGLDSIMPINGGLANTLPLNNLAGGLPVSGLAGQVPVVGPMAQNLPMVNQLTGEPTPTSTAAQAAGEQAGSDLKAAFPPPHMPTPPALMKPAHPGTRSRTVSPVAPAVTAPTIAPAQAAPAVQAPPAASKSQSQLPLVGSLPLVGGLTSGLPVGGLTSLGSF